MKKLIIQKPYFIWSIWKNNITCFEPEEAEVLYKTCISYGISCSIKWNDNQTVEFNDCTLNLECDDNMNFTLNIIFQ